MRTKKRTYPLDGRWCSILYPRVLALRSEASKFTSALCVGVYKSEHEQRNYYLQSTAFNSYDYDYYDYDYAVIQSTKLLYIAHTLTVCWLCWSSGCSR